MALAAGPGPGPSPRAAGESSDSARGFIIGKPVTRRAFPFNGTAWRESRAGPATSDSDRGPGLGPGAALLPSQCNSMVRIPILSYQKRSEQSKKNLTYPLVPSLPLTSSDRLSCVPRRHAMLFLD
jgi:hypothetical protein